MQMYLYAAEEESKTALILRTVKLDCKDRSNNAPQVVFYMC